MGSSTGGSEEYDDESNKVENIDHILDNMFVQRAPYQPATALAAARKSSSPAPIDEKIAIESIESATFVSTQESVAEPIVQQTSEIVPPVAAETEPIVEAPAVPELPVAEFIPQPIESSSPSIEPSQQPIEQSAVTLIDVEVSVSISE